MLPAASDALPPFRGGLTNQWHLPTRALGAEILNLHRQRCVMTLCWRRARRSRATSTCRMAELGQPYWPCAAVSEFLHAHVGCVRVRTAGRNGYGICSGACRGRTCPRSTYGEVATPPAACARLQRWVRRWGWRRWPRASNDRTNSPAAGGGAYRGAGLPFQRFPAGEGEHGDPARPTIRLLGS